MSADIWVVTLRGAISIYWVEAGDAAKHLIMPRTDAITKNYPAENINSEEVEMPWRR